MNKYELALVVSANVEDEVRTATIEKVNELITRFGGTITDPGTSEKKKLAYDIQHQPTILQMVHQVHQHIL